MIAFSDFLDKIAFAYEQNLPFVAYREPNETKLTAFFQEDDKLHLVDNFDTRGFVFAPFDAKDTTVLIPDTGEVLTNFEAESIDSTSQSNVFAEASESREAHINLVNEAKAYLIENSLPKVVIARSKTIPIRHFDLIQTFYRMLSKYLAATVYVWYHPKVGLWMGATPEMLATLQGKCFKTMSLAGTQMFQGTMEVQWKSKEREEQQLVTDYVLSKLKDKTEFLESGNPYTVRAGSLLHLRTDIQGELSEGMDLQRLLNTVHPTPAVCGYPTDKAKSFILEKEQFDRSFYTGYFGRLHPTQKTTFYVNLRCMQILSKQKARVYVGGGITQKSNAQLEWEETVAKCKTMEAVF
ncbi:MAG: chorismate-binding protein [Flavicella sp.]